MRGQVFYHWCSKKLGRTGMQEITCQLFKVLRLGDKVFLAQDAEVLLLAGAVRRPAGKDMLQ